MWNQKGRLHALLMTGFLGTLLCGARPSSADTYTVLNTNDSGAGSLRAAVASANGHAGADIVDFAPGVTGVITLTTGEISSTQPLTVTGPGAASLELNGNSASRIFNASASLTLTGLTFRNGRHTASGAGAVHVGVSTLQASDCVFASNTTVSSNGGAAYARDGATLTNCTFTANTGGSGGGTSGGALAVNSGAATLTKCTFVDNRIGGFGGAVNVNGPLVMTGCAFTGNIANGNGGSLGLGGAVAVANGSVTGTNCRFNGNSSAIAGGALRTISSPVSLANCTFSGNSTGSMGGGAVQVTNNSATLTNCTLTGNSGSIGGGLRLDNGPNVISNCILWGNTATSYPQLYAFTAPTVTNSDIQGGYAGTGNINQDPLFVRNPFTNGATDYGDLRLQAASPCYDTGSSALLPADTADLDGDLDVVEPLPLDLAGNPRVFGAEVDMGAYETMPAQDVTAGVQVRVVRFGALGPQTYRYYVYVTNISGSPIDGPISLALDSLPAGVSVANPTGFTSLTTPAGSPYWSATPPGGVLTAAMGVLLDVRLSSPTPLTSTLPSTQRVLAGPGPR